MGRRKTFSGLVTSLGNSEYFADASPSGNSILLISWETGNVEAARSKYSGRVAGLCSEAAADGQELLASIDGKTIARYSVKTGELLHTIDSSLWPVCCSPDSKVFIGYFPDQQVNGSMLLADGENGDILAVLSRGTRRVNTTAAVCVRWAIFHALPAAA